MYRDRTIQIAKDLIIKKEDDKYAIYRYYDNEDILLYIGISFCPFNRYGAHKDTAVWFSERVTKMTIEWVTENKSGAEVMEKAYIAKEKPIFNKTRKKNWTEGEIKTAIMYMSFNKAPHEAIKEMKRSLSGLITGKYGESRWSLYWQ
jgi:hypothetical protein